VTRRLLAPGSRFGAWTVLADLRATRSHERHVLCRCACGAEHPVFAPSLELGRSRSCIACGTERQRGRAVPARQANRRAA
jgi:hypothetical protein